MRLASRVGRAVAGTEAATTPPRARLQVRADPSGPPTQPPAGAIAERATAANAVLTARTTTAAVVLASGPTLAPSPVPLAAIPAIRGRSGLARARNPVTPDQSPVRVLTRAVRAGVDPARRDPTRGALGLSRVIHARTPAIPTPALNLARRVRLRRPLRRRPRILRRPAPRPVRQEVPRAADTPAVRVTSPELRQSRQLNYGAFVRAALCGGTGGSRWSRRLLCSRDQFGRHDRA